MADPKLRAARPWHDAENERLVRERDLLLYQVVLDHEEDGCDCAVCERWQDLPGEERAQIGASYDAPESFAMMRGSKP